MTSTNDTPGKLGSFCQQAAGSNALLALGIFIAVLQEMRRHLQRG